MSRFVDREATDTITLANGDTVDVRQRLTAKEHAEMQGKLIRFEYDTTAKEPRMVGEWASQQLEVCHAYIVAWDFRDDAGQPVPYSADKLPLLDSETVEEIAKAVDALQAARKERAEKNVSKPSPK